MNNNNNNTTTDALMNTVETISEYDQMKLSNPTWITGHGMINNAWFNRTKLTPFNTPIGDTIKWAADLDWTNSIEVSRQWDKLISQIKSNSPNKSLLKIGLNKALVELNIALNVFFGDEQLQIAN